MLAAEGIHKWFGGLHALDDVTLSVQEGEICALIGPNGSGKSTFFNLASGLMRPDRGRLLLDGGDITRASPATIARRGVGRTFQIVRPLAHLTCLENLLPGLLYGAQPVDLPDARGRARDLLDFVELEPKADAVAGDLSLWEQKSLEVARALSVGSRLLLLDEVFAGVSPADLGRLIDVVRRLHQELGATILLVEHVMRAVMDLAERVIVLSFGEIIAEGVPGEIVRHPKVVEVYLGAGHSLNGGSDG